MWIKSLRVRNYKSFEDSDWLQFDRRVNVVVGANHSGKSALLGVVGLKFVGAPHRNSSMRREEAPNPTSTADFRFSVSGQEVRDVMRAHNTGLLIPIPLNWTQRAPHPEVLNRFLGLNEIVTSVRASANQGGGFGWSNFEYPSTNLFSMSDGQQVGFMNTSVVGDTRDIHVSQIASGQNDTFGSGVAQALVPQIYFFDAQRIPQNSVSFGRSSQLHSNASNLAEVLNVLQASRTAFAEYVAEVSRVIPAIKWVSVTPSLSQNQHVEIRIWNVPDSTRRDDLAIPLVECGTGVGQVLSILYVRMRSTGNVIVIDEPNSFLHPRAAKALIGILKEGVSNQYVISTHSPEIVVASDPDRFFSLRFADEKTHVTEVARSDLSSIRQVLDELGSQLSDVFGADSVIWVEGPTEVQCFPLLLRAAGRSLDTALAVAPLRSTGDLEGRHGRAVADIYRNLSSMGAILPRTLAVSLDGDKRGIKDREALERAFGATLHFLNRRCFENYLIHPGALSALLNRTPSFSTAPISNEKVNDWIRENGGDQRFKAQAYEILSVEWLEVVDAPALLDELFQSLSASREIYRKPLHSVELTRWLLENDSTFLADLIAYVAALIP